jgi:hypothetical protein
MTTTSGRVISKDGLLYRLAYQDIREENRLSGVNLCVLVGMAMVNILELIVLVAGLGAACCLVAVIISVTGMALWYVGSSFIAWLADPYLLSIHEPGVSGPLWSGVRRPSFLALRQQ